jgi:hypothetical protein
MKRFIKNYGILLFIVLLKFGLQYIVVNPVYELHRDEFLHLDQAFHLSAGYQSVPPFTSWVSVIIFLLGGYIFWIRFFPALFGVLTIIIVWLIVEKVGGGIHARILAALGVTFSVLVRLNILYQPNSFDVLIWTLIFYCFICYVRTKKNKWIIGAFIAAGFGMLNKYNVAFLLIGLIPAFLVTFQRNIFTKKAFYLGMLLFLAMLLPNIIWQIVHNFPVLHHMQALRESQLVNVNRSDFLIDQLKFYPGSILVIIGAFIGFFIYKPFKAFRFIGWAFLFTMTIYCYLRAKNYYTFGLYPILIALGSVYLESVLTNGWKKSILYVLIAGNILAFYPVFNVIVPRETPQQIIVHEKKYKALGLLRWEDGKDHPLPQDFSDMLGWREMAEKTRQAYLTIPENEREQTIIFTDNYGQVGALNYYNRGKLPQAYSFNTDYIFWIPQIPSIKNIVLVGNRPEDNIVSQFESITQVGKVENPYARENGTQIWLLKGANIGLTEGFYKLRKRRIETFDIY